MRQWRPRIHGFIKRHRVGVALLAILLLALIFRFWRIWELPPGLYEDEAANGLDIINQILKGNVAPFYLSNNGRESLFFFIQTPFVKFLGNTALALRLPAAVVSLAVVGVTYSWAKEWFSRRTALIAALFTATGTWAVTIGRLGFRAGMVPLMIAACAYTLTKSYKTRRWYWHILAGISLGTGFYTYLSFRMMALILPILFIYAIIWHRKPLKRFIWPLIMIGLVAGLVLAPMGVYTYKHRSEVLGGRNAVSITNQNYSVVKTVQTLAVNTARTALMFNFRGDENFRHNLGGAPMLNAFVGIMFVFGVMLGVRRIKDIRYFTLLLILSVMTLPAILTVEGIPHALRTIGVLPAVYVLAAIGLVELMARWKGVFPRNPAAYTPILIGVVVVTSLSVAYDYRRYFVAWANAPETYNAFSSEVLEVANYLNGRPNEQHLVLINPNQNRSLEYLTYNKSSYERVEPTVLKSLSLQPDGKSLVVSGSDKLDPALLPDNADARATYTGISADLPSQVLFRVYQIQPKG